MRISEHFVIFVLTSFPSANPVLAQKQLAQSPRILSTKSVYFNNKTGSDAVGKNALAQLRKGGKFQLVADPKQADVIFILSADPYNGGNLIFASGQTGTIDDGHITEDPIPNYNKQSPTRYAYLTVIDPKTGGNLWSDQHSGAACPQVSTASAHVSSRNSKTKLRSKGKFRPLKTQETAVAYLSRFIQSPNGQVPAGLLLRDESRPLLIGLQFVLPPHLLQRRGWKARSSELERARILVGCEPFYQPVLVDFTA